MRKISHLIPKTVYPAARLVMGILLPFALVSCSKQGAGGKPADVDYYTCSMHPSVKMQNPTDKCPICSMNLVPVKKKSAAPPGAQGDYAAPEGHAGHQPPSTAPTEPSDAEAPGEFAVPVTRQQEIGVTYATVEKRPLQLTVRTVGLVAYDKLRRWDNVTRVDGYVDRLFVASRGELVEKDQPLVS